MSLEVLANGQARMRPTMPQPDVDELEEAVFQGVCPATDGCIVEPDGECEHGHVSWLRYLGII
jgi:hypothetical protein